MSAAAAAFVESGHRGAPHTGVDGFFHSERRS
ncbi:MAG: hypothetical protein QOI93_5606, partial [Rhodospirillaceae bacterium]|nr:hypothetical protein [Rhodospirillaceae bacterium]